jgi:hypothetical protein
VPLTIHGSTELQASTNEGIGTCRFRHLSSLHIATRGFPTAMSLLRHLSQRRQYVCHHCVRRQHTSARVEAPAGHDRGWIVAEDDAAARKAAWAEQAGRIKAGEQKSMLSVLEERGFVKDVAG